MTTEQRELLEKYEAAYSHVVFLEDPDNWEIEGASEAFDDSCHEMQVIAAAIEATGTTVEALNEELYAEREAAK